MSQTQQEATQMASNDKPETQQEATPAPAAIDLSALANDEVAEYIPVSVSQEIQDFVQRAHEFWKATPKKWRRVVLADEKAVAWVVIEAAKYARSTGRTFRIKQQNQPEVLIYKVTDKVRATTAATSTPVSVLTLVPDVPADNNG